MSLDSLLEGAERHTWSDERGTLSLVRVRDGVALVIMVGKLGDEAAAAWEQHFAWLIGRGQVRLFIDAEAVTMPGTAFISTGTKLIGDIRPRIEELHVLVGGGLIEMVAKTVNLTLGGLLQITRDRAQFKAALEGATF